MNQKVIERMREIGGMTKEEAQFAYRVFVKAVFDEIVETGYIAIRNLVKVETKVRKGRNHPIWGQQKETLRLKWTTLPRLRDAIRGRPGSIATPSKTPRQPLSAAQSSRIQVQMKKALERKRSQQTGGTAETESRRSDSSSTPPDDASTPQG